MSDNLSADLEAEAVRWRRREAALSRLVEVVLARGRLLMIADAQECFDTGADPDGNPWAGLAIPRARGGNLPLRDQGLLAASVTAGPGHVERSGPDFIEVGTNRPGAATHQRGATIVPRRGKYLAIPRTPGAAAAGSPRYFAGKLSPRFGARGGVLLDSSGAVQYILTRGPVVVPRRRFIGFGQRLKARLADMGRRAVAEALKGKQDAGR